MTTNLSQERKLSVACVLLKMRSACESGEVVLQCVFHKCGRKEGRKVAAGLRLLLHLVELGQS